jgi:hypothetical protein
VTPAAGKRKYFILQAQDCIDRFEYELAQKFCQRALEMEADNVRALETSGALLIDLGNLEAAKQVCHCLTCSLVKFLAFVVYENLVIFI